MKFALYFYFWEGFYLLSPLPLGPFLFITNKSLLLAEKTTIGHRIRQTDPIDELIKSQLTVPPTTQPIKGRRHRRRRTPELIKNTGKKKKKKLQG